MQYVHQTEDKNGGHVNRERDEEHEEVAIVASPDAVVHPRAVVVKDLKISQLSVFEQRFKNANIDKWSKI